MERGLEVNDDAELRVDEIVAGISEECRPLVSAGPLGRGFGWRDEFWHNVAGAPRRIVEGREILRHRVVNLADEAREPGRKVMRTAAANTKGSET
jgi:hypothetical protein